MKENGERREREDAERAAKRRVTDAAPEILEMLDTIVGEFDAGRITAYTIDQARDLIHKARKG